MEEEKSVLFSLSIDDAAQNHLLSIANWNKFLGITGIVMSAIFTLSAIVNIFFGFRPTPPAGVDDAYIMGERAGELFVYLLLIAAYLIPSIIRVKFANRMVKALNSNDQFLLNGALSQLKIFTKFFGIVTIVMLALSIIGIAISISTIIR